ncbi:MAG: ROK family protein [Candidatus Pelagibacter sp. TMED165]|nr:MAG: ROK family protein [Candidatus Pelagibacter sp. TMED165]|tara:strand:+ start:512 stop:1408 length:897 start_codon:yes stop_codon:yes gene_type:complete
MQIGIDLGATKIEYVLLDKLNKEIIRNRIKTPNSYNKTVKEIIEIILKLQKNKNYNVGICHPGSVDKTTGLIKNAHNSLWLNKKNLIKDIKKKLDNNIFIDNDANCFSLSESIDGSASHYETVFGIILGSGCGGGLVINKKIISGSNGLGGEWSLNQMPLSKVDDLEYSNKLNFNDRIEGFLSGKSIERNYYIKFKEKLKAEKIFYNYRKKENKALEFIKVYKDHLSRALVLIITTIDPDAIVFGGGISNEIDFLDEIKSNTSKYISEPNLKTVFLKPLYGDASGVRGAALLGRQTLI